MSWNTSLLAVDGSCAKGASGSLAPLRLEYLPELGNLSYALPLSSHHVRSIRSRHQRPAGGLRQWSQVTDGC